MLSPVRLNSLLSQFAKFIRWLVLWHTLQNIYKISLIWEKASVLWETMRIILEVRVNIKLSILSHVTYFNVRSHVCIGKWVRCYWRVKIPGTRFSYHSFIFLHPVLRQELNRCYITMAQTEVCDTIVLK